MIKEIEKLYPFCYPIDYTLDLNKLIESIKIFLSRINLNLDDINNKCNLGSKYAINLTHLPKLTGSDRWKKYNENHPTVEKQGVKEVDFIEHLEEIKDLYLGQVIHEIYKNHNKKFQGRTQLVWVGSQQSYNFHKDLHTPDRYHVPIFTNKECFFLLKKAEKLTYKIHMPADGRVWYLDPIKVAHNFYNQSNSSRLHLLLTNGIGGQ